MTDFKNSEGVFFTDCVAAAAEDGGAVVASWSAAAKSAMAAGSARACFTKRSANPVSKQWSLSRTIPSPNAVAGVVEGWAV